MFVSTNALTIYYGVDDKIAQFFVDREPPKDNLYWKDKLLYLRLEPGYIFIPLIVDVLYKLGIDRAQLLSDKFIDLMEAIGNISALEESKKIDHSEAVREAKKLALASNANGQVAEMVSDYFTSSNESPIANQTTPFKALHRGDLFLFSICALDIPASLMDKIVQHWFALISTLLLLDDAEDIEMDAHNKDDNAFLEAGLTKEGIEKIQALVRSNLQLLSALNKPLALRLDQQIKELFERRNFQKLLN
jgi:hypothetical protein